MQESDDTEAKDLRLYIWSQAVMKDEWVCNNVMGIKLKGDAR